MIDPAYINSGATMEKTSDVIDPMPARMLNEFTYCPRLYHLMHVEGRWADNAFTVDGKWVHHRVDSKDELLPEASGKDNDEAPEVARSVTLTSERLGIVAKLDLVEVEGGSAVPVETKRGRVPNNAERSWEPERVQLMAQGLLLREHGYDVDHGFLYFRGSRTRVRIDFTPELEARTLALLDEACRAATSRTMPPPLIDSPKCTGCSLNGICMPDETHALQLAAAEKELADPEAPEIRQLYPPRDDALPLYVQEQGAYVAKTGEGIRIKKEGVVVASVPLKDISQLVLCGNITVTPQALHLLVESGIPIVHLSMGNWFYGITSGFGLKNSFTKSAQFIAAADETICLQLAKSIVAAKGQNQRTLLRRNAGHESEAGLESMHRLLDTLGEADSLESLRGYEGNLAARYFENFGNMVRPKEGSLEFDFINRNRRPPRDPVNALLSFGYTLLTKECTVACAAVGLDPFWGFYHQPRHGRPALALDLMEEFRPLLVDSAVITAINTGAVQAGDFEHGGNGCMLNAAGRKAFIRTYEARLDQLVTHPLFSYRCSWRRIIRMQAELLARFLRGDIPEYTGMVTR